MTSALLDELFSLELFSAELLEASFESLELVLDSLFSFADDVGSLETDELETFASLVFVLGLAEESSPQADKRLAATIQ